MNKRLNLSGNLAYILGTAFVIASVVLNLVPPRPVLAGQPPDTGNPGAIWTTYDDCGATGQDKNHYPIGGVVFIHGSGFNPNVALDWDISGQPGEASGDPGQVVADDAAMTNPILTDANGDFCFNAYTIAADDWGEYHVTVGKNKHDNYRVDAALPVASASVTTGQCTWTEQTGSLTSVTIILFHASLVIYDGATAIWDSSTDPSPVSLSPGSYTFTWVADQGYTGGAQGVPLVIGDCTPGTANASVSVESCVPGENDSLSPVTITVNHATLTITDEDTSTVVGSYTSSQTLTLPAGNYSYSWTADAGYTGGASDVEFTVVDCTPGHDYKLNLSHIECYDGDNPDLMGMVEIHFVLLFVPDGITPGTLTYTYGSIEPGAHTGNVWHYTDYKSSGYFNITSASVDVGGVTVNLENPGVYTGTYNCAQSASAEVAIGACVWTEQGGSSTPVTITLDHASLIIYSGTTPVWDSDSDPSPVSLAPSIYTYTWVADPGYTGGQENVPLIIGSCIPASFEITIGTCTWDEQQELSLTSVAFVLVGAELTIEGVGVYTASGTVDLEPGTYNYSWEPTGDFVGSGGSGQLVIGECIPEDASAEISIGECVFENRARVSSTPVTITLDHAWLIIDGITYEETTTVNFAPGSYDYTWGADPGYRGGGEGSIIIGECPPENGTASVFTGGCSWSAASGSQTPVNIFLSNATFTINGQIFTSSTTINLPPGDYIYTWQAVPPFVGSGSGILHIGSCAPLPVPTVNVSCYSMQYHAYRISIGNSGLAAGEIGYSTNLDPTIVSLGIIPSGGTVLVLIPQAVTTLYVYPGGPNGWGTPISVLLSTLTTGICEDPMTLDPFCSYLDLSLPHGWTVTNVNAFPVEFTWIYGPEASPAPIPLAAGATFTFFTADHPGAVMQIYVDGILMASAGPVICPQFLPLGLDGVCSSDPEKTNAWVATNPNSFAVAAEWQLMGTTLTGLLTLAGNSSVEFTTEIVGANDSVQLYSGGIFQDGAFAAVSCLPPVHPPETPPGLGGGEQQVVIPVTAVTPILIPVTGFKNDFPGMARAGLFSLGLCFFGLGTVLHGVSRRRDIKK